MRKYSHKILVSTLAVLALGTATAGTMYSPTVFAHGKSVKEHMMATNSLQDVGQQNSVAEANINHANTQQKQNVVENKALKQEVIDWDNSRPQEKVIDAQVKPLVGKTVLGVSITGLHHLSTDELTKNFSLVTGSKVTVEGIKEDRNSIYQSGLCYDNYPTFRETPSGVYIDFHVMENPILTGIEIEGNKAVSTSKIESMLKVKEGTVLNTNILKKNLADIEAYYSEEGYILAKLSNMSVNEQGVLTLTFNEGILEGYKVEGNVKTKTKVILREMRMKPGQPFNAKLARRSLQRLYNLGFFQNLNIKLLPGKEPNSVIMEIIVEEKKTGSFGIGGGYSSADGVIGTFSLRDKNFRGTGDSLQMMYEFGRGNDDRGFSFNYYRPWVDSKQTSLGFRLYNRSYEYDDYNTDGNKIETYDRKVRGEEVTLGRPQDEYTTNYITLHNSNDEYKKHVNGLDRSHDLAWLKDNFGSTRSITLAHVKDTRDNIYTPSKGMRYSISVEKAGFGGDFNYTKYILTSQKYFSLGHSHVFLTRLNGGYSSSQLPDFAQFQIGGQGTLRGYKVDQFKGNKTLYGTFEYQFPLVSKVRGAVFFDYGDAWSGRNWKWQTVEQSFDLHHSYGVGVQVDTPLGPLRLDYGIGEDGGRTSFSVGGTF